MNRIKATKELENALSRTENEDQLQKYLEKEELVETVPFHECFAEMETVDCSELVRRSCLDRTYAYQILEGRRNPSRDKEIALCLAAGLSEEETNRILKLTGYSRLYARRKRDAVLIYAFHQKLSVMDANLLLNEYGEEILK